MGLRSREGTPGGVFLSMGFRPFFLAAAVYAVLALALWVGTLNGAAWLPGAWPPLAWHRHEMLFGVVAAIIAGFLLTAVPNWTGRTPLSGAPLAALVALWLAARLASLLVGMVPPIPAAAIDGGFLFVLAIWTGRQLLASGNRNLPVAFLIASLGLADIGDYAAFADATALAGTAYRFGLAVVLLLISLIGGRIVPAFTRNWLRQRGKAGALPVMAGPFDRRVLLATAFALLVWSIVPDARASGALLLLIGVLHGARLLRWAGWRTAGEPLLLALHLAYLWLPAGFLLLGIAVLFPALPVPAALHALTAGAIGAMTLAVMTRASLGHGGRPLHAGPGTVTIFVLVHAGALMRVLSPLWPEAYMRLLVIAGTLWGGAYLLFALIYAPLLLRRPRRS